MAQSFYLIWQRDNSLLRGFDLASQKWVDGGLVFPISFPNRTTSAFIVTLRSSARDSQTFETLKSVKLYLTGDATDLVTVQQTWPTYGSSFTPARTELNGGFEISFDQGRTYTRFDSTHGLETDPATWIGLPASAVGLNGIASQLGPFDMARFLLRYHIPPSVSTFKKFDIRLAADFDIV